MSGPPPRPVTRNDDRQIFHFYKKNVGIWRCDGCPLGTEGHTWGPGQAFPGMCGHAADPEGPRAGFSLVHGLPPMQLMRGMFLAQRWRAG
eukprot:5093558-Pyramimonas_sp.AAC.1